MTRLVNLIVRNRVVEREMPQADVELLPGIRWGDPWVLFTPAYWLAQAWMSELDTKPICRYRSRHGIVSELGFCLLGGYGITAELATAVFNRCSQAGLFARRESRIEAWAAELSALFQVGARCVRYRYPNQKARFLASAMTYVQTHSLREDSGRALRDQLLDIKGVGYKTASWISRNVLDTDDVAILDVHIIRAGRLCGLFSQKHRVERDYLDMEERFLAFCDKLKLRPASLDCLIWDQMRAAGSLPYRMLSDIPARSCKKTKVTEDQLALLL